MENCKICGSETKSVISLTRHLKRHKITPENYYLKYISQKCNCLRCGNKTTFLNIRKGFSKYCCLDCSNKEKQISKQKRLHKKTKDYKHMCKMCDHKSPTLTGLGVHITKKHYITTEDYILKFDYSNNHPKCHNKDCDNQTKFFDMRRGFNKYCSCRCLALCGEQQAKANKTLKEKYGEEVTNRFQLTHSKEKMKKTNLRRYGTEHFLDSKDGKLKFRNSMEEKGLWVPYNDLNDFDKYRRQVERYTSKNRKNIKGIEKRGTHSYHVDHKYSVFEGFKYSIPPWIIGSECNLEMLYYKENISKNNNCSISKKELLENYFTSFPRTNE